MTRVLFLVAALLAVTVLIVWLVSGNGQVLGSSQSHASLVYSIVLLVTVLASVVLNWRGTIIQAATYTVIWVALFFALVLGYSYRDDFKAVWTRMTGEINPALAQQTAPGQLELRKANDGHFYADVEVNGTSIRMLADTGASTVTLSESDARAAGIDTNGLTYNMIVSTANGEASAARVTIDEIRIGSIVRRNVTTAVTRTMEGSLLGMSFFSTLSRFEMSRDKLVLVD
ncbi:MAG: TIGR02281 family clan AA aspartic protease [Alphaproteobacteria bacterium]|nr:TIGR02281 family clan AA aspartic protease [Alphaproteobacteria bacterium]